MILKAIASLYRWIHAYHSWIKNFKTINIDELFLFFMVSAVIGKKQTICVIIELGLEYVPQRNTKNCHRLWALELFYMWVNSQLRS